MDLADYHLHTPLCRHATGTPEAFVAAAVAAGLTEIGFSCHSPMAEPFDDWRMDLAELPAYLAWVESARALAPFPVRLGLEVDWLPHGEAWIQELARMAPWDYFIGSVHYLGTWNFDNPAHRDHFDTYGITRAWEDYWTAFTAAAASGHFHIMGHPDLIKKFNHHPPGDLRCFYEPAIAALAASGTAIEINTAGLFKDCADLYPSLDFLKMARAADIPLTINSDAHDPTHVGRAFPEAVALARTAGYTQLATPPFRRS
jgi:histidinol-phosphatase (PHP family)